MTMEKELQEKYKISYAIAHECIVGAKKQLNITSDAADEAEEKHDEIMSKADEIYKNLPAVSGEKPPPTNAKDPDQLEQGNKTFATCPCFANICCCLSGQVN